MGKMFSWVKAVIANNHPYATMAGVDIKKSADRLFESDTSIKTDKKQKLLTGRKKSPDR